jgi:hypothetical protein
VWRAATQDDDPEVVSLYLALESEDPGPAGADSARALRTLRLFQSAPERGRCVVLDEGGRIDGYALLVPYWSNELGGLVCCVDEMYVAPR